MVSRQRGSASRADGRVSTRVPPLPAAAVANLRRTPDGKPDLQGFYESKSRGANQGFEKAEVAPAGRRPDRRSTRTGNFRCSPGPWRKGSAGT